MGLLQHMGHCTPQPQSPPLHVCPPVAEERQVAPPALIGSQQAGGGEGGCLRLEVGGENEKVNCIFYRRGGSDVKHLGQKSVALGSGLLVLVWSS